MTPPDAMLRIEQPDGWMLVEHRDHAQLAGKMAAHWGNDEFPAPSPRAEILAAVARHDDAWAERDAAPLLTRQGLPGAFSRELVGSYTAFEEIDLIDYLAVRGRATEAVARDNPYAAILVSMHTVNLLTEQADLSKLSPELAQAHREFIDAQLRRQAGLADAIARAGRLADAIAPPTLRRGFELLQACDSLSLIACVQYPRALPLRHQHPRHDGGLTTLQCTPLGENRYRVAPYPFDDDELAWPVPCRSVRGRTFAALAEFRAAYRAASIETLEVTIVR